MKLRTNTFCFALLLALVLAPASADAFNSSAWTRPRNQLWSLWSYGRVAAGTQFFPDGREAPLVSELEGDTFVDESFIAQLEFGLVDWLTLSTRIPYKQVSIELDQFFIDTAAQGNLYLGLRLGIFELLEVDTPFVWSFELGVDVPMGYTRNLTPSVGPGNLDIEAKTAFGYGFRVVDWLPAYSQVGLGLRVRSSAFAFSESVDCNAGVDVNCIADVQPNYSDELLYLAEVGVTPLRGTLLLFAKTFGNFAFDEPDIDSGFTAANPIPVTQRFTLLGFGGAVYPVRWWDIPYARNIGVMADYYTTIDGRNVLNADHIYVRIEYTHNF
ncbi:MAG: hypothetical protein HC923_09290 [Myxococcales bacterium]|nr:hypothetical protein [Myxococcales bacterium]